MNLLGDQQIILRLQQVRAIVNREFEIVAVRDRIFRTSFDAEAAKDATAIIYVVDLGEAFIDARALFGGTRIVSRLDVDAFGRAGGSAQKTRDAFLPAKFVDVQ